MRNAKAHSDLCDESHSRINVYQKGKRTLSLRPLSDVSPARWITSGFKTLLGWIIFRSGLYRLAWRGKAVIVVFHRVRDSFRNDPITVSSGQFEQFVRFFARHFDVIPLTELLARV